MSRSGFKRFEFFDVDSLSSDIVATLGCTPTCAAAEGGMLMFGDRTGHIILSDRNFHISARHRVFRGEVKGLAYLYDSASINKQYIVVLGDDAPPQTDSSGNKPPPLYFVKIYAASDFVRPLHVLNATVNDAVMSCFAVLSDGYQIAVGYENGAVILFSGRYLQEVSNTPIRNAAYSVLQTSHSFPVTSLHFCEIPSKKSSDRRIRLFAVMDTPDVPALDLSQGGDEAASAQRPPDPGMNGDDPKLAGVLIFDTSVTLGSAPGNTSDFVAAPRHPVRVLDERGAPARCASFMRGQSELVVARNEAVYNYSIEDRGGALAIAGDKQCICAVGRYTMIVSVEERTAVPVVGASAGAHGLDGELPTYMKPKRPVVNIYDLKNKIICGTSKKYHLALNDRVLFCLNDGGVVYLITTGGSMLRFREKDTHRKLDVLLNQTSPPLYSLAIMLAAEEQLEPAEIMKLYKQYGDHLYEEKDFDGAIAQYSHTVGYIPSSSVITKFLDPYRISNLIAYLEKMHAKNLAASDHITLLLSCYAKIRDDAQINNLLESIALNPNTKTVPVATAAAGGASKAGTPSAAAPSVNAFASGGKVHLDVTISSNLFNADQAIHILHTAGYTAQALKVAARYHQHRAYLDIQMKKTPPQYDDALAYFAYLPFVTSNDVILSLLRLHGRALSQHRATIFTALLLKLCTADYASLLPHTHPANAVSSTAHSKNSSGHHKSSSAHASAHSQHNKKHITANDVMKSFTHLLSDTVIVPADRLPIAEVLYLFSSDQTSLLSLLQGFVDASPGRLLPAKVSTTLMELYLSKYSALTEQLHVLRTTPDTVAVNAPVGSPARDTNPDTSTPHTTNTALTKQVEIERLDHTLHATEVSIMGLLDGAHSSYDPAHALLLCHTFHFERGQRFLLEKQQSTDLLMRMLIQNNDVKEVFKVLRREGSKDPELYVQVLTYFVQQSIAQDESRASLSARNSSCALNSSQSLTYSGSNKYPNTGADRNNGSGSETNSENSDDETESESSDNDEERWNSIMDVMDLIEKDAVLSPLQVISILAQNPRLPLHVASTYMSNTLKTLTESIEGVQSSVQSAMTDIEAVTVSKSTENKITPRALRQQERAQRRQAQRAAASVHRIGIGANQALLDESLYDDEDQEEEDEETEEQERLHRAKREEYWLNLRQQMVGCSADNETFFKTLAHNPDGFNVVVEHFGRSIIS